MLLSVSNLTCGYYRDVEVLHNVSLELEENSIVAIIGPNGAGKSTLLNTIFGFINPKEGKIDYNGENIAGMPPHVIKRKGISYITQIPSVFPQLTVEENIELGAWTIRKNKRVVREKMEEIYSDFEALKRKSKNKATFLSGGELKMLELAKGIITHPKIVLFDEPTAGLAPKIVAEVYQRLAKYKSSLSILLVDQNIKKAIEVADYVYFLERGTIKTKGPKETFQRNIRNIIKSSLID